MAAAGPKGKTNELSSWGVLISHHKEASRGAAWEVAMAKKRHMEWVGYLSLDRGSAAERSRRAGLSLANPWTAIPRWYTSPARLLSQLSFIIPSSSPSANRCPVDSRRAHCRSISFRAIAQPAQRPSNSHTLGVALSTYRDFGGTRARNNDEEFSIAR